MPTSCSCCSVDTGREIVQVVCGAPNARAGMKGVFAPPGTFIPGSNFTLGIAKIRGVESRGMMCSERELQLSRGARRHHRAGRGRRGRHAAAAAALGFERSGDRCRAHAQSRRLHVGVWHRARSRRGRAGHAEGRRGRSRSRARSPRRSRSALDFPESAANACTDVRRPPDPRREERAEPRMGAEPAEGGGPASDLRAGRRHQSDRAGSRPAAARVRRGEAQGQHARAAGEARARRSSRSTARPTRSMPR